MQEDDRLARTGHAVADTNAVHFDLRIQSPRCLRTHELQGGRPLLKRATPFILLDRDRIGGRIAK